MDDALSGGNDGAPEHGRLEEHEERIGPTPGQDGTRATAATAIDVPRASPERAVIDGEERFDTVPRAGHPEPVRATSS